MAELDLAALTARERYRILATLIAPRPIAFVSSLDASGRGNLAPFSCFGMGGIEPLSCVVCAVVGRDGADKDTTRNILETGEFVVNVVTHALADRMNAASFAYDAGIDEFERCGLTRIPARTVRPPRVAESPAQLECRLFEAVRHGSGPGASVYLVGEVVHIAAADEICTDGLPDNHKLDLVARLGGDWYLSVDPQRLFAMTRPAAP